MLNHGNNKNYNIPKKKLNNLTKIYISHIHHKIKWKNNLRFISWGFVLVES